MGRPPSALFSGCAGLCAIVVGSATGRTAPPAATVRGAIEPPLPPHAVVWVEGPRSLLLPASARRTRPRLTARGLHLEPYFTVVQVGQTVELATDDGLPHRLFSGSAAHPFDLGRSPGRQARALTFDRPGVVDVFCRFHAETHAVVVVVPPGRFAIPDDSGRFHLDGLPPGRLRLEAHSPEGGHLSVPIVVAAGGDQALPPLRFPRHDPREDGGDGDGDRAGASAGGAERAPPLPPPLVRPRSR